MKRLSLVWMLLPALLLACGRARTLPTPVPALNSSEQVAAAAAIHRSPDPFSAVRFSTIGLEDGLSQSTVLAIAQDAQGFLWFGTQDGLNRYDGYEFKVYAPIPGDPGSISDRWITDLYVDPEGYLWIATRQGGLNQYDPQKDRFIRYQHRVGDPSSISSDNVRSIAQDPLGYIWAGTSSGLERLDPQTGEIRHYRKNADDPTSLSSDKISALFVDSNGILWVGSDNEVLDRLDPATGTFRHYRYTSKVETTFGLSSALSIQGAANGNLWIATSGDVILLDPATGQTKTYKIPPRQASKQSYTKIFTIAVDRGGTLWIGTDQGLNWLDEGTGKVTNYHHAASLPDSLSNNVIEAIYEDREGILWIGTYGGGVSQYDRNQDRFRYYRRDPENPDSLISDIVFGFYTEPSGGVWIATVEGLDYFDPADGKFRHYTHDPTRPGSLIDNFVWTVFRDSRGMLWVGTQMGLDRLDETSGQFIHYQHRSQDPGSLAGNMIYRIYQDRSGNLWFGTNQGLDRYDPERDRFIHYHDPNDPSKVTSDSVISIEEDAEGRLWAGTFNFGLFRLDKTREEYTYYQNDPKKSGSLSNNSVMAIRQDQSGSLWIATTGGLNKYEPAADSFAIYTEQDGLPNNVIYAVIPDKQGFLWLSTNLGLSRFDPRTKTFRNYTKSDGLQGNEFNQGAYAQDQDGRIYLGGINGFNVFNPERVQDNTYMPPIVLTGLKINAEPVHTGEAISALNEISLQWPQDSFEFDFTALSYADPQNNQYAYQLENFDREWNQIGNKRNGRYTNLPGGSYILRINGSNNDRVWNDTGKAIRVTVKAPFWKTTWFYGLSGLFFLGAVVGIYRWRVHRIEAQKLELERLVNERARKIEQLFEQTKALAVMDERNRLARELHDSAKQKAFASLAQLGTANGLIAHDPTAAQKHLTEAENLVSEVIQELTFLIQEMYPIALQEKGLANALLEYLFEWEARTDIRVNLHIEGESQLPLEIEQAIYRIVQESLANIARHSRATRVEFKVEYLPGQVKVSITDDGLGFDLQQKPNGIGLRSMHERAKSVGGSLEVETTPGQGTRVIVQVPTSKVEHPTGG